MAKRGRKKLTGYDKYVSEYNKAAKAQSKNKQYRSTMVETPYTKRQYLNVINLQHGSTIDEKISQLIYKQRFGHSMDEAESRRNLMAQYNIKVSNRDLKYLTHQEFADKYSSQLSDLYGSLRANDFLTSYESKVLISNYVFGSV